MKTRSIVNETSMSSNATSVIVIPYVKYRRSHSAIHEGVEIFRDRRDLKCVQISTPII